MSFLCLGHYRYIGWKGLFPEKLLLHPSIKAKLSQGLIMMNRSVSGGANLDNIGYKPKPTVATPVQAQQRSESFDINTSGVQIQSAASAKITSFRVSLVSFVNVLMLL